MARRRKMDKNKKALTAMMVLSVFAGALVAVTAGGASGFNVIWDNGMDYNGGTSSQNDSSGYVTLCADDFIFTEQQTVRDVHWIGNYNPAEDGDFDWEIIFYNDNGTGNQPGSVITSFYFLNAETHETYIETLGDHNWYDYSVNLPAPVELAANTKYWISIQGIGSRPPQSYWAQYNGTIMLHEALFKSEFYSYPDWTNISSTFAPVPVNMCFQLTNGKAEVPALTPTGLLALVSLLSAITAVTIVRKRR
jgi:hypothetical protein